MTIKIYSTPACGYCKIAKEFLTSHNISYTDVNVAADPAEREAMVQKSGQLGVPVFEIDGQIIVGYNQALLAKVVGITPTEEQK